MNFPISLFILCSLVFTGGICWVLRRVATPQALLPVTAGWIDELSLERYRPMAQLLSEDDLESLLGQPGFTPHMIAGLRAQRCRIFRGYLRGLSQDFERVCVALKIVLVQSGHDRPDLASTLLRERWRFAANMFAVRVRLVFYRWGWSGVDARSLMHTFDGMRQELQGLVPVTLVLEAQGRGRALAVPKLPLRP
jgi:hypothetical protein